MQVAPHRADGDDAHRFVVLVHEVGAEDVHGHLHGSGGDEHFGHVEFVVLETLTHDLHACDQSVGEYLSRGRVVGEGAFGRRYGRVRFATDDAVG